MKTAVVCLGLISVAVPVSAQEVSLTGTWHVHNSISGDESDQACTFTQTDDGAFTGKCSSERGNVEVTGKVKGKKVTWMYKSEYEGTPLTVNYDGTLGPDNKITGNVTVPEFSADGEFTATPSK